MSYKVSLSLVVNVDTEGEALDFTWRVVERIKEMMPEIQLVFDDLEEEREGDEG